MFRRHPRSTRTYTLFPCPTLFRSYSMRKPPCKAWPHQTKDILSDRTSLFQRGCKGACFPSGQPVTAWLLSVTWLPVTARLLVATLLSVTWLPADRKSVV